MYDMRKEFIEWLKSDDYIVWRHDVMNCYSSDKDLFQMAIQYAFERGMDAST